jgi:predicted restriction endonuclease
LEDRLDDLWGKAVKKKFRNKCAVCGTPYNLQAAHVWSRKNKFVRWDILNGICLCIRHHIFWAHTEPIEFARFCEKKIGEKTMKELEFKAHQVTHYTMEDLMEIKKNLEAYLEEN